jgi:hypothetical protein
MYPAPVAGYGYVASPPTDGMAIAALIVGIISAVGIFCYGVPAVILGPIALFLGLHARSRIKASGGAIGGGGLAMAGWITGLAALCVGAVFLLLTIGVMALGLSSISNYVTISPSP